MKFLKNKLIYILPIISGILLILAYPPCNLGLLVFITLIPLLYFLSLKSVSIKKALIGGIILGLIFFGKLFGWLFATVPFEWIGVNTEKHLVAVFFLLVILYLIQTIFLSLFLGGFSWTIKKISPKLDNLHCLFIIPGFWIIFEYLRAWGFGILYLGKETLFGPHWTFGNLAYTLHNIPLLIQVADIIGIYGISFLIVLVNTGLFLALKSKKKWIMFVILILVVVMWGAYGAYRVYGTHQVDRTHRIALLQTNFAAGVEFNSYQRRDVFRTVINLFQNPEISKENPDFIIAPEGFGIVSLSGHRDIARYLLKDFWRPGQIFLENQKIIDENNQFKSRLFYYDLEKENPIAFHDKMLLVPNGDFMPYLTKVLLSIYSFNLDYQQRLAQPGRKTNVAQTPKGNIGGTICSSILSPNLQRQMTKKGAQFLVVVSSDAPFHGAKSLLTQNLAMSKLRAIENRRYFAQATNMGYSFLINPEGQVILKSSELGNEILFSNIRLINKKTIYTKFGDWVIVLTILLILFSLTFKIVYNKKYGEIINKKTTLD